MRIIGGQAKGRRIAVPRGSSVRPTSDRIKEALFNILGPLEGRKFLDLYAGTGNVGIEALSRGAEESIFVERMERLAASLRNNLEAFSFSGRYTILRMDVERAVVHLAEEGLRFDFIFADPPYRKGFIEKLSSLLNAYPSLLADEGTLVVQHAAMEPLPMGTETIFELVDSRRYGDTVLSFLVSTNN